MDRSNDRQLASYDYYDPKAFFDRLVENAKGMSEQQRLTSLKRARSNKMKDNREIKAAALFALGLSACLNETVWFRHSEEGDRDCILARGNGSDTAFQEVQLKELPPESLNARADLDAILEGVRTRSYTQTKTWLAVEVNRNMRFDWSSYRPTPIPFAQLWFFGYVAANGSEAAVWGDYLDERNPPTETRFELPWLAR
jgi:hypothetical protein